MKNTATHEKSITRLSVLKEMQDMAWHNLFCYSANYAMTKPKEGAEEQWAATKAKADIIDQMIAEAKLEATS